MRFLLTALVRSCLWQIPRQAIERGKDEGMIVHLG